MHFMFLGPSRGAEFIGYRDVDCVGSATECRTLFVYWKVGFIKETLNVPSDFNKICS